MGKDLISLYDEVTAKIIAQLEEGGAPWVQPWESSNGATGLPRNGATGRAYSGINILILWAAQFETGYDAQNWLTYKQAQALGGNVMRGEKGTTVCYADRYTPKDEERRARDEDREARQVAFLKRFTVFNVEQCEGLPGELAVMAPPADSDAILPRVKDLIAATGARFYVGGESAFYAPAQDVIHVPPPSAFYEPINWHRTALHELAHWTGHVSRLDRLGDFDNVSAYAREELCAEMASAFLCAELGIVPTVRHSEYIRAWLTVLKEDNRAIFRAASLATKAAAFLLAFEANGEEGP